MIFSDFGKNPVVVNFYGNHVGVRRVDGSLVNSAVPMTVSILHELASTARWEEARKLCRLVKVNITLCKTKNVLCTLNSSATRESWTNVLKLLSTTSC